MTKGTVICHGKRFQLTVMAKGFSYLSWPKGFSYMSWQHVQLSVMGKGLFICHGKQNGSKSFIYQMDPIICHGKIVLLSVKTNTFIGLSCQKV